MRTGKKNLFKHIESAPWLTAGIAVCTLAIFFTPGLEGWLQFDRHAIARGDLWRIIASHGVHWTAEHLIYDLFAFVALAAVIEITNRRRLIELLVVASLSIGAAVWFFVPEMRLYRGLSGVDSALYVFVCMQQIAAAGAESRRGTRLVALAALAGFMGKIGFEIATGGALFATDMGGAVAVPVAHMAGALAGAAIWYRSSSKPVSRARHSIKMSFTNVNGV